MNERPPIRAPHDEHRPSGRYLLDRNARRLGSRLLLGGEPTRLFRLSESGASALDRLLGTGQAETAEAAELAERLVGAGILHPLPDPGVGDSSARVTVVIPARNPPESLDALLSALGLSAAGEVIVVDDGSDDGGAASAAAAARHGAQLVRRQASGGPASARNAARPTTALVAYLDADMVLDTDDPAAWLRRCAAHFDDGRVGLVAPRVRSAGGAPALTGPGRWIEAYERLESPLDIGPYPGLVGTARRLSYVPAAALVARRKALEEVGGFDESLRYGEDVDLVRRLESAGWLLRYEPAAVVGHHPRPRLASFVRQRIGYGTAAAEIERRHPGTVPPFVATPASVLSGVALLTCGLSRRRAGRTRLASLAVATAATLFPLPRLAERLGEAGCPRPARLALWLSARSTLSASGGLLAAVRRGWWPIVLPGALSRPTRRATFLLLGIAAVAGHVRPAASSAMKERSPGGRITRALQHLALGALDDGSYGTGVLFGCWRARSVRALAGRVRPLPTGRPDL